MTTTVLSVTQTSVSRDKQATLLAKFHARARGVHEGANIQDTGGGGRYAAAAVQETDK